MDNDKIDPNKYLPKVKEVLLSEHLSYGNLISKLIIDKVESYTLFCPKCLGLQQFNRHRYYEPMIGDEVIIYQCGKCETSWMNSNNLWDNNKKLERLIFFNDFIAHFGDHMQLIYYE